MNAPVGFSPINHERLVTQLEEALRLARDTRSSALPAVPPTSPDILALAKAMLRARRRRDTQLCSLGFEFGEPAWDLLLDLFISAQEGCRISVSSACVAANVPATTALRWIAMLTERGLIVREHDPIDKRRHHLRLSSTAIDAMERYLSAELANGATG